MSSVEMGVLGWRSETGKAKQAQRKYQSETGGAAGGGEF